MGARLTHTVVTAVIAAAVTLTPVVAMRTSATTTPPEFPSPCTAEAIGADTGLILIADVVCSAGFAMGALAHPEPTADAPHPTANELTSCTAVGTCMHPLIFHVTLSGWVNDGFHGADCAEDLGVFFMSPQTAATFATVCEPETWPAPEEVAEGDSGAAVMYVQIALVSAGYELAVDGVFGPSTTRAVTSFQREHGLDANGIVGPETHALLGTGPPTPGTSTTSTTSTATSVTSPSGVTPSEPRPCTAEAIGADTGLVVVTVRECAGGWTLGLTDTTCPPLPDDPDAECESADVFHLTRDGWVHDGAFYPFCAETLATETGMSIHTALSWSPICDGSTVPERVAIEPGQTGPSVRQLQIALVAAGYPVSDDGRYGPRTETAVRDFQARNGLTADGVAGPDTQAALGM